MITQNLRRIWRSIRRLCLTTHLLVLLGIADLQTFTVTIRRQDTDLDLGRGRLNGVGQYHLVVGIIHRHVVTARCRRRPTDGHPTAGLHQHGG